MVFPDEKVAGTLVFIAVSQFILGLVVAEALWPEYSMSKNYISDLGVGSSSAIFNSSIIILGLLLVIGTYFLQRVFNFKVLTGLLLLTAIGIIGVGVFTEHFGTLHSLVSLIALLFGGLSATVSYKLLKSPFSILTVILGSMSLGALILYGIHVDLGMGVGGMERMIVYPILVWGAGFGGYLIANAEKEPTLQESTSSLNN
jgi:hypothetical membrane protein